MSVAPISAESWGISGPTFAVVYLLLVAVVVLAALAYANARNRGVDPVCALRRIPLERMAYGHVAGGIEHDGLYHDTHTAPTPEPVLRLVGELAAPARIRARADAAAGTGRTPPAGTRTARGAGGDRLSGRTAVSDGTLPPRTFPS